MKRTLRIMFIAIEINLIMWLLMLGVTSVTDAGVPSSGTTVLVGLVLAAVVQHWAYYTVYKWAKQMQ